MKKPIRIFILVTADDKFLSVFLSEETAKSFSDSQGWTQRGCRIVPCTQVDSRYFNVGE